MTEAWCVLLAGRQESQPALIKRGPLAAAVRRAGSVTSRDKIVAVVTATRPCTRDGSLGDVDACNLVAQPEHQGTAHEVLLALLQLESRVLPTTPVLFLPTDHVVNNEKVMTRALRSMIEWMTNEPQAVYLLGAVPQGPHDQLGYIVPWHGTLDMPTSVYEFVEGPEVHRARKLINAGGLWNTFIFGGTFSSLVKLFPRRFDAAIAAIRTALRSGPEDMGPLSAVYEQLTSVDLSHDVLATQTDSLHVLRLPPCGWWPLKSPTIVRPLRANAAIEAAR